MNNKISFSTHIIWLLCISCTNIQSKKTHNTALESKKNIETISKKNTDIRSINNIERPKESKIINAKFPVDKLFGIWTYDPNGPHADFKLDNKYFYVVDYDGDGNMPYLLNKDTLTVYYNDFITKGIIKKITKDSLIISWDKNENTNYTKWKQ